MMGQAALSHALKYLSICINLDAVYWGWCSQTQNAGSVWDVTYPAASKLNLSTMLLKLGSLLPTRLLRRSHPLHTSELSIVSKSNKREQCLQSIKKAVWKIFGLLVVWQSFRSSSHLWWHLTATCSTLFCSYLPNCWLYSRYGIGLIFAEHPWR